MGTHIKKLYGWIKNVITVCSALAAPYTVYAGCMCIITGIIFCIFFTFPLDATNKFKGYDAYRTKMRSYYDDAALSCSDAAADARVNEGLSRVTAEWEQDASLEIERSVSAASDTERERIRTELAAALKTERDEFTASAKTDALYEKGLRAVRSLEISIPANVSKILADAFAEADATTATTDYGTTFSEWESRAASGRADARTAIASELTARKNAITSALESAAESYRNGFLSELDSRLGEIRAEHELNTEIAYVTARNAYFYKAYNDRESLRLESESKSAEAAAQEVIGTAAGETQDILAQCMYRIIQHLR